MNSILITALLPLFAQDATLPPVGTAAVQTVEGRGVQIYRCEQKGDAYAWNFQSPEAELFDSSGAKVGTHGAGPSWTWSDGSSVRSASVMVKQPSPDSTSVPWLLVKVTPAAAAGTLANIAYVRRSNTRGGNTPLGGCDATHANELKRVDYTATYTFYATK